MKEIIIRISPDAEKVQIEADGYKDSSCLRDTAAIEAALGVVKKKTKKGDIQNVARNAFAGQG